MDLEHELHQPLWGRAAARLSHQSNLLGEEKSVYKGWLHSI
jgi:hypothetical protein